MNDVRFAIVKAAPDIKKLAALAKDIWEEYFVSILTKEQISYMVENFQSERALTDYIVIKGYEYYFIEYEDEIIGYFGIHDEGESLFLSKLYLRADKRGNGFASKAFSFIESLCLQRGLAYIRLTVNKQNAHSIAVYDSKGFKIQRGEVTDIGNGFVMDDYVMIKRL